MGAATSCRAGYASGHGLDKLRALFLRVKLRLELRFQVQLHVEIRDKYKLPYSLYLAVLYLKDTATAMQPQGNFLQF